HRLLILGAVVMNLVGVMDDITTGGNRNGTVGIKLLAGPHPPGSGQDHKKTIVGMKVRPAHISREPSEAHDVRPGLAWVAEENRRLVGSGRVTDPFDVCRCLKVDGAAIDIARAQRSDA